MEKTSISTTEYLFYGFYFLLTIAKGMGLYEGMRLFDVLVGAAFLFLLCKLVHERYTLWQLVLTFFILMLGVITWQVSGKMGALFNLTLLVGLRGINHRRLIQISAAMWEILFTLQCFLTISGIRTEQIFRIHRKLGMYIVRWSMGFTHPNVLHITYFILIALLFCACKPRGKRKLLLCSGLAMIGNLLLFCYSVSYTGVLIVTVYLLVNILLQSKALQRKWFSVSCGYVAYLTPIVCVLFSTVAPVLLQGKAFDLANRLLSTRLELSRQYILGQGIHLFGNANMETVDATITVDCSYVYMLVHYGLIYFVLFCALLEMTVIYCWKKQKMDALAVLMACTISGVTEQYMANTSFKNISILIIAVMFYENPLWERTEGESSNIVVSHLMVVRPFEYVMTRLAAACELGTKYAKSAEKQILAYMCKNWKRVLLTSIIAFIVGVVFYCSTVSVPSALYASLWDCDRKEGAAGYEYIYDTELLNDPDFDGWILSDRDSQGRLYAFDGLTVTSEYYRRAAGRGFALVILVLCIEGTISILGRRKEKHARR